MSILKVDNIRDNGTGFNDVVSFQNANGTENGRLCRAFVNFNGDGAVAIRANFNVNSITDHGVGDFTATFTNAMSDANYSINGTMSVNAHTAGTIFAPLNDGVATGSVRVIDARGQGQADRPIISVAIFR